MWIPAKMVSIKEHSASIFWEVTCWSSSNDTNVVARSWCRRDRRLVEISCEILCRFCNGFVTVCQMFALVCRSLKILRVRGHKPFWMVNLALPVLPKSRGGRDTSWSREPIRRAAPYPTQWLSQLDLARRDKNSRKQGKGRTGGGKYFEACSEEVGMYLLTRQRWTLRHHPQNVNSLLSVMFLTANWQAHFPHSCTEQSWIYLCWIKW